MSSDMESLALSPRPPPTIGPLRQQSGSSVLEDHRTPSGLASDLSVLVTPHHHHHLLARTLVGVLFLLPDGFQLPPIHLHMRAPEDSCLTAPVTPPPLDGPLRPGSLNVCSVKIDVRAQHQRRHQHHHGHGSVIGRGGCALLASIIFSFFFPLFFPPFFSVSLYLSCLNLFRCSRTGEPRAERRSSTATTLDLY